MLRKMRATPLKTEQMRDHKKGNKQQQQHATAAQDAKMTAPWTKEWRPYTRQLCAKLLIGDAQAPVDELRVDQALAQLYTHKFIECTASQVAQQVEGLAVKLEMHALPERAERLRTLATRCHSHALIKLVLELARAPTECADDAIVVDDTEALERAARKENAATAAHQLQEQIALHDAAVRARSDDPLGSALLGRKRAADALMNCSPEELLRDQLLTAYYPEYRADVAGDAMDVDDDMPLQEPAQEPGPFRMEQPNAWFRASLVAASAPDPRRAVVFPRKYVLHEAEVVMCVFHALLGVESKLFEFKPVFLPTIVGSDLQTSAVQLSVVGQNTAVSHLTCGALHRILFQFTRAASDLLFIRDLVAFVRSDQHQAGDRSCTFEGIGNALQCISREFYQAVVEIQRAMFSVQWERADQEAMKRPVMYKTLLSAFGCLKPYMAVFLWFRSTLMKCICTQSSNPRRDISVAEQAQLLLTSLVETIEVEAFAEQCKPALANGNCPWNRINLLMRLFTSALMPYVHILERMLFQRSHGNLVGLHPEGLFIFAPKFDPTSPRMTFYDELLALAPFEVDEKLAPAFLKPMCELLRETLLSRQLKNKYLEQLASLHEKAADALGYNTLSASVQAKLTETLNPSDCLAEYVPIKVALERCFLSPLRDKCVVTNGDIATIFREELKFLAHVDALRKFVLMQQVCRLFVNYNPLALSLTMWDAMPDVFSILSSHLIEQLQQNAIAFADSERLNSVFQFGMQRMLEEKAISALDRDLGARIQLRVDFTQLKELTASRKIDIGAIRSLQFAMSAASPLHAMFSGQLMQKYSRLAVFLIQVKSVEVAVTKNDIRPYLLTLSDMLHYTKSLLGYLTSQVNSDSWIRVREVLISSRSLLEINEAHEGYLEELLNKFFLLEKHHTVIQYILTTFNHIMRFVHHLDELTKTLDQSLMSLSSLDITGGLNNSQASTVSVKSASTPSLLSSTSSTGTAAAHLAAQSKMRLLFTKGHSRLQEDIHKSSAEYKRQSHFLVVMLSAMQKNGASPHIQEVLTQLNFNAFYHQEQAISVSERPTRQSVPSLPFVVSATTKTSFYSQLTSIR
ncbi:TPA: LOW QUALITY PROTEIN: hypothetical protein N0F65_000473 [Lagenidium giganteum]|uniref:Spindle pole body component n=1 Tax=Lagenidium giganteum TaxID=4803 RepID=A0AAV2Z326_9STRA|nr:TPA: LOW QUALITY PROTEIN: hypothetical protein N0F65_000473 [Lagenidium giganteum]